MQDNYVIGRLRTGKDTYPCQTCGASMNHVWLNWEGSIHHGTPVECLNRKACERRKRKRRKA